MSLGYVERNCTMTHLSGVMYDVARSQRVPELIKLYCVSLRLSGLTTAALR